MANCVSLENQLMVQFLKIICGNLGDLGVKYFYYKEGARHAKAD